MVWRAVRRVPDLTAFIHSHCRRPLESWSSTDNEQWKIIWRCIGFLFWNTSKTSGNTYMYKTFAENKSDTLLADAQKKSCQKNQSSPKLHHESTVLFFHRHKLDVWVLTEAENALEKPMLNWQGQCCALIISIDDDGHYSSCVIVELCGPGHTLPSIEVSSHSHSNTFKYVHVHIWWSFLAMSLYSHQFSTRVAQK